MITQELLSKYPIISDQVTRERLTEVLGACERILQQDIPGDIVEFGCYIGTTSLFLRRLLDAYSQSNTRTLHVYDSFEGLPEKQSADNSPAGVQFKAGELRASKKRLMHEFQKAQLNQPIIHKGWFSELTNQDIPVQIAFAFLDGDFYGSIMDSMSLIWPNLNDRAIVVVDDYGREALPGPEKAVRDFLKGKTIKRLHAAHNIGIIEL